MTDSRSFAVAQDDMVRVEVHGKKPVPSGTAHGTMNRKYIGDGAKCTVIPVATGIHAAYPASLMLPMDSRCHGNDRFWVWRHTRFMERTEFRPELHTQP